MLLRKTSIYTGREAQMEFPDDIDARIRRWQASGRPIQEVMPDLTPDQRQFLLSGSTSQEWDELFNENASIDSKLLKAYARAHTVGTKKEDE